MYASIVRSRPLLDSPTMSRRLASLVLLLTACTAPPPNPATPAVPAAPAAPAEPAAPAAPAVPAAPATPVTPVTAVATPVAPSEPIVSWWCVCYSRTTAVGGEPLTACRATEAACHSLEKAVAAGHRGMVARSLTHPCEELKAAHPGDVYGGRAAWQASKKAGSWRSPGTCQLPGEGELVQAESGPNVMGQEALGDLHYGMPASVAIKLVGQPSSRGSIEMEEATGSYVQSWTYKDQGLDLVMAAGTRKGSQTIYMITVAAPSTLKTHKGIGIGSSRKDVLAAYGTLRDPEDPSGDQADVFIAGSIYGGVFFTMVADKVSEIFIGAGAE